MTRAFDQPDSDAAGGSTAVWSDAASSALLFVDKLNVNTDGTRRSYSVTDFWGEQAAINTVCNAMSDGCAGLDSEELRQRRLATQEALDHGWPAAELAKTKISPQIIPFRGGKPCPLAGGFLVSATALFDSSVADVCSLDRYLDALKVPALVLPKGDSGFHQRGAAVGDLVATMVPGTNRVVFAVVGDLGPKTSLGEGSVALNASLLRRSGEPRNRRDAYNNWVVPKAAVLVLPRTGDAAHPYTTATRIEEAARTAFQRWGGESRFKACVAEYSQP